MDSTPTPSLLGLPVELRLEIFGYFWTIPYEEHFLEPTTEPYPGYYEEQIDARCLKVSYLKAQLSAISTLGAICQKIRHEAYAE